MQSATELTRAENRAAMAGPEPDTRVRLRYGLNIGDHWTDLAAGPQREALIRRIREAGTALVRVFLRVENSSPAYWPDVVALLDAIQATGATPMVAFPVPQPWNEPGIARKFSRECGEFVERSVERWGHAAASWFWSIGDEPNSPWTNGGLTFEGYRDTYEAAADAIRQRLCSPGERPRVGGPCVDGFQGFWFDWIWRFTEEIDDSLIGFAAWNRYGEWREPGAWSAPADADIFERLLLSRTGEYRSRAEAVGVLLEERGILNFCSELNAHSHTDPAISSHFNQGLFGAVYYALSLIELIRGGADGEFLWAGAGDRGPYGALPAAGGTTPAYEAKKLIARHVLFGDRVWFPLDEEPEPALDALLASGADGRRAAILVHRSRERREVAVDRWPALSGFSRLTLVCGGNHGPARREPLGKIVPFDGYRVALLDNQEDV